jgi:double-stranded uracil-DNA glycosylase
MGFTRAELEQFRGQPVDDLIGPAPRLLLVGINPGLWTAAVNAHFARPGNRFWPALHRAGIVDRRIDASRGLSSEDLAHLEDRGVAITNLVNVATARADELAAAQLRAGGERLRRTVRRVHPRVVAVLGLTAYRQAFGQRGGRAGRQPEDLEGAELWVLPNPSGLNAHETLDSLASAYREAAEAAGVIPRSVPPRDGR